MYCYLILVIRNFSRVSLSSMIKLPQCQRWASSSDTVLESEQISTCKTYQMMSHDIPGTDRLSSRQNMVDLVLAEIHGTNVRVSPTHSLLLYMYKYTVHPSPLAVDSCNNVSSSKQCLSCFINNHNISFRQLMTVLLAKPNSLPQHSLELPLFSTPLTHVTVRGGRGERERGDRREGKEGEGR